MVQAMRAHRANLRSSGRAHRGGGPTEEVQLPAITCFGHPKAELFFLSDLLSACTDLILKGASFAVAKMSQGLKPGEMRKRVWHDRKYGTVGYTRDPPAASGRPARAGARNPFMNPSVQS